jgi:hypothetical protein
VHGECCLADPGGAVDDDDRHLTGGLGNQLVEPLEMPLTAGERADRGG